MDIPHRISHLFRFLKPIYMKLLNYLFSNSRISFVFSSISGTSPRDSTFNRTTGSV
ncbi:hypothetical protein HMPREF1603_03821, partial [Escherichia coli 907892]